MVADISSTHTTPPKPKVLSPAKPKRAPLVTDNNNAGPMQRRPKPNDVPSRYLSYSSKLITDTKSYSNTISTNKFTSPSLVSNTRDHDHRNVELSTSAKMLTKTYARSLSVSFQGESFALPVSKVEKPVNNGVTKDTERKKTVMRTVTKVSENSKTHAKSQHGDCMTMSVDFTNEKVKLIGSDTVTSAVKVLQKSMTNEVTINNPGNVRDSDDSDHTDSDPESISSGSNVGHVRGGGGGGPRAIVVPARFWQETINLLRRVQPVAVAMPQSLLKTNKMSYGCKVLQDGPKLPPRGCNNNLGNAASVMSLCADAKRGKVGEKKLVDAHELRVLHNKHMQWRFANARVDAAMVVQRAAARKTLYNAWVTISKLWHSVISKRLQLQQLMHNLKLHFLLKKQMFHLDNWDLTDRDYSISLAGAIMALESSSLCLPVLSGAKVDIQNLKDAICSVADVMQDMAVSICSLVTKVENVNLMASELASAMKTECSLLDQCKDLLSTLTLLEQQDCSLRAHTLQLIPAATMTQRPKMMPF